MTRPDGSPLSKPLLGHVIRTPGEQEAFNSGYSLGWNDSVRRHDQFSIAKGYGRYVEIAVTLALGGFVAWLVFRGFY